MPPQAQHNIQVHFLDGTTAPAVRTGNNAAWHCQCERTLPLVGYSDSTPPSSVPHSRVECPDCDKAYQVVAPTLKGVPTLVQEVQ